MIYDLKTKKYREPDPNLRLTPYAQTLIDHKGRAVVVTRDFKLARFDPATDKLEVLELRLRRQAGRHGRRQARPGVLGDHGRREDRVPHPHVRLDACSASTSRPTGRRCRSRTSAA